MISTFKQFGTGIIEDVVVNHRNGATNWYDFPAETYNGKTYKLGLDAICKNDEPCQPDWYAAAYRRIRHRRQL